MKKKIANNRQTNLKVKTSFSLNKTKPAQSRRLKKIQKTLINPAPTAKITSNSPLRLKPESQIAQAAQLNLWLIPARFAFVLNGFYYLAFSIIAFLSVFSNYKIIQPFFVFSFDTTFSSFFLLEMIAAFSLITSLLYFHAAQNPRSYRWFYFFIIVVFIPYHFISNLQKLQVELPQDFQNYLYFDTIVTAILWAIYILSVYSFLKLNTRKN